MYSEALISAGGAAHHGQLCHFLGMREPIAMHASTTVVIVPVIPAAGRAVPAVGARPAAFRHEGCIERVREAVVAPGATSVSHHQHVCHRATVPP
eukprot:COSAG05_NODE_3009_length_2418_cov_1.500216_4_plen_95_part_00